MLSIDIKDKRPLYLQVIEGIENLTLTGIMRPNEQLPSVRSLAMELSINPNTIQRAYLELEKRGITYSIPGKGSFVSEHCVVLEKEKQEKLYHQLELLVKEAKILKISEETLEKKLSQYYNGKGREALD